MDAEVKFTFAIVKHNAPFQLAESLSPRIQDYFSDSKVAISCACSRTKTCCIILQHGVFWLVYSWGRERGGAVEAQKNSKIPKLKMIYQ